MIIDKNWAVSSGGAGDNKKLIGLVEGTIAELTTEDLKGATKIGQYAFYRSALEAAELPNTITDIGQYAFGYCTKLSNIDLPNNITELKQHTFENCSALKMVSIPETVKSVGSNCFYYSGLQTIDWGEKPTIETIGTYAFQSTKLTGVVDIPDTVKTIGGDAFNGALTNASEFYLPDSLLRIINTSSSGGIVGATTKFSTTYENIRYLPSRTNPYLLADGKISSLETQIIHKDCKVIGSSLYYGATGLKNVVFEEGSQLVGVSDSAFRRTSLQQVDLPETIQYIGRNAFSDCKQLQNIDLHNVKEIDNYAFDGCNALVNIDIPKSITRIGDSAFYNATGLKTFEITSTIKEVGDNAFLNCSTLSKIIVNAKPEILGSGAFSALTGLTELYWNTEPWGDYTGQFLWYGGETSGIKLTVGDNVSAFSTRSFGYAGTSYMNITNAIFGSSITEISGTWLYQKNLAQITLKSTIPPTLQNADFRDALQTIYIPAGTLEAYSTATNWSKYADKFVELPAE